MNQATHIVPKFKSTRNGVAQRDFNQLHKFLMNGAEVYIKGRYKNKATFFRDRFINEEGIEFLSPFAFSKHVTKKYTTDNAPSGWDAIYTGYKYENNNIDIKLGELYDLWERNLL